MFSCIFTLQHTYLPPIHILLAIVGPSGAGKTTFLDIMAGRKSIGKVEGKIFRNGISLGKTDRRKQSAYVYQKDILPAHETAREYLSFQAALRKPNWTVYEIHSEVERILNVLGLHHCADQPIGDDFSRGISGGEKRRISIGVALIGNPPILLMDEV